MAQASLDVGDGVEVPGPKQRHGTFTLLTSETIGGLRLGLLSGHVALPYALAPSVPVIQRRFENDRELRITARDHDTSRVWSARLTRGAISERGDWALVAIEPDVDVSPIHPATGCAAPLATRTAPLTAGMSLFLWSGVRRKLVAGRLRSPELAAVTLRLPDDTAAYYARVLVVDWAMERFSEDGDSGALVVSRDLEAVGVLVGASRTVPRSFVTPIPELRVALGADFGHFFASPTLG